MDATRPPTEINQHVALDINAAWFESVRYKAGMSMCREPPANPTILRVPPCLRCNNQQDYEPKLISIGPYHRGKSGDLEAMEELKWRMLHHYFSIIPNGPNNEDLIKMKHLEKRARDCYSEVINLDSDQFIEMLLLDGCFLVQIFITQQALRANDDQQTLPAAKELESLLSNNMWFGNLIIRDLLLLENQLPYFIIEHLLETLGMHEWDNRRLQSIAISCFIDLMPQHSNIPWPTNLPERGFQVDHLLHLFHKWISCVPREEKLNNRRSYCPLPSELLISASSLVINKTRDCLYKLFPYYSKPSFSQGFPGSVRTITELAEVGVKIKVREAKSFLDISYDKARRELGIPAINVDSSTSFFFANLVAFEQCDYNRHGLDVSNYILFLDDIINKSRDVQLLHQEGIIYRGIDNDDDIASLFNRLGKDIFYVWRRNYLKDVCREMDICYQSRNRKPRWPRWCAEFALLILVLTIVQTVYTVFAYYKK